MKKASVIVRAAEGDVSVARSLLGVAQVSTVEMLQRRVQERAQHHLENAEKQRDRLRRSQYVNIRRDDNNMVLGQFRLLLELCASWLSK